MKLFYIFRLDSDELDDTMLRAVIVSASDEKAALEVAAKEAATEYGQDGWTPDNVEVHELSPGNVEQVLWTWGGESNDENGNG
jgi:hypothetical protein